MASAPEATYDTIVYLDADMAESAKAMDKAGAAVGAEYGWLGALSVK